VTEYGHSRAIKGLFAKREEKPDLYGGIDTAASGNTEIGSVSYKGRLEMIKFPLAKRGRGPICTKILL
jgi:hypothetical protein